MTHFIKILLIIFCIVGLATSWYLLPIFHRFPNPKGPYVVGTTAIELTDNQRKEIFSQNSEDDRILGMRLYYPAQTSENFEKYPYLGNKISYYKKLIATYYGVPEFIASLFLRNIPTHSFINPLVAISEKSYPVILFSHGLFGLPSDSSLVILENLASWGYIVVAIDHSYLNMFTPYKNGMVVTCQKLNDQFNRMSQKEQKEFQSLAINVYKADMKFLVDELVRINNDSNSIFYQRINLEKIAAMGHSAGGTASIEFCRSDNRCKAAIDLDGWYDHVIGRNPINKPLLLIFGSKSIEITEPTSEYLKRKGLTREQYFEREKNIAEHRMKLCSVSTCSFITIPDVTHDDFGDRMFIKWPLRPWSNVDAYEIMSLINEYIVNFLDHYLKRQNVDEL